MTDTDITAEKLRDLADYIDTGFGPDKFQRRNIAAALRAYAAIKSAQRGWQPIETAPKDGRTLLLWCPALARQEFGSFRKDSGFSGNKKKLWLANDYDDYSTGYASTPLSPTHWMPLPSPPKGPQS